MTLFDLIVVAGTAELVALGWTLTALAWPRGEHLRGLDLRRQSGHGRVAGGSLGKAIARHRLAAPRPEGESVPGG